MLIELPIVWIILVNVAGWPVIQFGLAWLFMQMPVAWFNPGGARAWEQGGRFYKYAIGIKRWKDWLPDGARWFGGGFAIGSLAGGRFRHPAIRAAAIGVEDLWFSLLPDPRRINGRCFFPNRIGKSALDMVFNR